MTEIQIATLKTAITKLDPGGWSLTVNGFARRALKMKPPLTKKQETELSDMMDKTGLVRRQVKYGSGFISVWDYQA